MQNTTTQPIAAPTARLVFDEPVIHHDATLPTASWWDRYEIQPGAYPFEWTNLSGAPWNPDPAVRTPGFIANVGPYYGVARVTVRLIEQYRENRLFAEVRGHHVVHHESVESVKAFTVYAYQLPGCPTRDVGRPLTTLAGGRIEAIA